MNGLQFCCGLGVGVNSCIDLCLQGGWYLLCVDFGIDDVCCNVGGLQFQVWGDNCLLYDSGLVKVFGVVKLELDICGFFILSLCMLGVQGS